jgi:hypothetical protein
VIPAFLQPIIGPAVNKVLDLIPNKNERERAREDIEKTIVNGALAASAAQNRINEVQAGHKSIFVAGARPAVMWICAAALGWNYVMQPILGWIGFLLEYDLSGAPKLDAGELTAILTGMLGLGGYRTFEKMKGVSREIDPRF